MQEIPPTTQPGQITDSQSLPDAAATRGALIELCSRTRRTFRISSHQLAPTLFDDDQVADALSHFARGQANGEIRILIADSRSLAQRGHRLLTLSRRLPSKVIIRQHCLEEHERLAEYCLADEWGVLTGGAMEHEAAHASFTDRVTNRQLREVFDAGWQRCGTPVELRRLSL